MSLPPEIINDILYKYKGLRHKTTYILNEHMSKINKILNNKEFNVELNCDYNYEQQEDYIECLDRELFDLNIGSKQLWKLCIDKFNQNNNKDYYILSSDNDYLKILKTDGYNNIYDNMFDRF